MIMVSFWPFRRDDNSAASFEKTLSGLSQKIAKASGYNDSYRQRQRRYKVLWTLYTSFAYILIALILTLVTGWDTWGAPEITTLALGPVLIYIVRSALDAYYNWRIAESQSSLDKLIKQRETTIEKLKIATKYNSTQQLLDKYGGTPKKRQSSPNGLKKRKSEGGQSNQGTPQGGRTGFMPPPTANIPGRSPTSGLTVPQGTESTPQSPVLADPTRPSEEFAPNAFGSPMPRPPMQVATTQYAAEGTKWYDRILDVVLGEDETQAKNRIVLICDNCRLVNGQAPPGTRTLEEVGKWRCSSCQAWNGVESEENRILKQISAEAPLPSATDVSSTAAGPTEAASSREESSEYEEADEDVVGESEPAVGGATDTPPANSTRSKARQRKKA